jgi:hypothetical protein
METAGRSNDLTNRPHHLLTDCYNEVPRIPVQIVAVAMRSSEIIYISVIGRFDHGTHPDNLK